MANKQLDKQKLLGRIFAIIVLTFAIASLLITGLNLAINVPGAPPIPDPPMCIAFVFVAIGLVLEIWKPTTEWKLQKKMLPLLIISASVAVWTMFTFNILTGRYLGGPENPFDQHFAQQFPLYTLFTGTFFFGLFYPIYLVFRPSAKAIAGGVIYNIIVPTQELIGRGLKLLPPDWTIYVEDFILTSIGVIMFICWYVTMPKEKRKFLGIDLLWFVIAVDVITTSILLAMVYTGIFKLV